MLKNSERFKLYAENDNADSETSTSGATIISATDVSKIINELQDLVEVK